MLSAKKRAILVLPVWLACTAWMWMWWLNSARVAYAPLFIPLTASIMYEFLILPSFFLYFILRAKLPPRRIAPKGKKVAVITLCVPSQESMGIIETQLRALSEIKYPHDSWILDEGRNMKIKRLAGKYGVNYFSRKGIAKYNQPVAPFKAKTKAGNVNAWLDHVRHTKYEYFVQLDIDHNPKPNYLEKTLGYFRDEQVAWVQAPSVYKNLDNWVARAASEQELVLQGPLQMGFYGHSQTPFIIGSHSTYRMSAIDEIGGFQPTRAEDHLDTLTLASRGWKGVFVPEVIAEGDGPETLNTYLSQQFAWAYSMFQILLHHSFSLMKSMPFKQKLQFMFSQTWYPLWSLSYLFMFLTPAIAIFINRNVSHIQALSFLIHYMPMFIGSFLIWWAGRPLMQPKKVRLSWRGVLLHSIRWPVVFRAVLSSLFNIKKPYMITPKGSFSRLAPTVKLYAPFLILSAVNSLAILFSLNFYTKRAASSQILFVSINQFFMLAVCLVDLNIGLRNAIGKVRENFKRHWLKPITAVMSAVALASIALVFTFATTQPVVLALTLSHKMQQSVATNTVPLDQLTLEELEQQLAIVQDTTNENDPPKLGVYDPKQQLASDEPYIRHSFIDWRDDTDLAKQLFMTKRLHAVPLITIMPAGESDGGVLLRDIVNGKYDSRLSNLFDVIAASKNNVYLRFAHEMDLANLYPWGSQDPTTFISAYRHVVNLARAQHRSNIKWVWAPAGNSNAALYYPGSDVVDVVGATVLYDKFWYGNDKLTFDELSSIRQWLQQYGKPVWIVEFGAGNSDTTYQTQLIQDAVQHFQEYGYSALVYLNIADSNLPEPNYWLNNIQIFDPALKAGPGSFAVIKPSPVPTPDSTKLEVKKVGFSLDSKLVGNKTRFFSLLSHAKPFTSTQPERPVKQLQDYTHKSSPSSSKTSQPGLLITDRPTWFSSTVNGKK